MKTLSSLIIVFMLLASSVAYGQESADGNMLLKRCNSAVRLSDEQSSKNFNFTQSLNAGVCLGKLEGMRTMNMLYRTTFLEGSDQTRFWCLPGNISISNSQAARIVVKYLNDHPEKLHDEGWELAVIAFNEAFPCK
ncbi:hypothetical protein ES702_06567 [subsurface metagenome]